MNFHFRRKLQDECLRYGIHKNDMNFGNMTGKSKYIIGFKSYTKIENVVSETLDVAF